MIKYVLNTLGSFRSTLAVGLGLPFLMAASASAQAPAPEATTERVIVTGSYIPTSETESALPVTIYTAEVLQKSGSNTPVEGLRQLPSFVGNAITENDSNGGNGQATINLRGVGSENTLVLINGRRATLGRGANGLGADINAISIAATARTEVLKDGASAIYGSDAVAGVVNFVFINGPGEKPYEGAELFAHYGNTTDTDAHVRQVFVRGGVTGLDGKVSIAASGEYYSRANLFSRDRSISTTGDLSNDATGLQQGGINNNSPTFPGRIALRTNNVGAQLVLSNPGTVSPNLGAYRPFDVNAGTDESRFNFRDFSPAIPAVEKAFYYVTGRYKVFGDALQLYGDVMYAKTKQDNGLAGSPFSSSQLITSSGNLSGAGVAQTSRFNPFATVLNPDGTLNSGVTQFRYRLHRELGNRRNFTDADYYRYVAGINGDFNFKDNGFISRFGYDTGFVYERYSSLTTDTGDADARPLADQVIAGNFNPYIGGVAPLAGTALIYNNSNPAGANYRNGVSIGTGAYDNVAGAQAAAFLGHSLFAERDWAVDVKLNAHLFPNLWNGGIDLAGGYEHRESATHSTPDPVEAQGFQLGFNASPNTKYLQKVDSFFVELTVPIVTSTMNVPFVRSLELSGAFRYEKFNDYDQFKIGNTGNDPFGPNIISTSFDNSNPDEDFGGTPRLTLRYQPIADVTLRASWGQSFRSPTPDDLFNPGAQNFPVLFDPFQGNTLQPPSGTQENGNASLLPEKSDAYSAGVVWTPKFLPGFTMTVDMYQLFTRDLILTPANFAQVMLTANAISPGQTAFVDPDGCLGLGGGPQLGITRDDSGAVDCIDSQGQNAGKRLVEGLDVTAAYEIPTERFGKFTVSGAWNHFFIWKAEPFNGLGTHNFLGDYNNGTIPLAPGGVPFNKAFLRGEWEWHNFDFVITGNYVGDYEDDPAFILDNTITNPGEGDPEWGTHRRVSSYETLDMQLSYEWIKPAAEPAPVYAKDAKDGKNVMAQTEASSSSIWQRMLWGTKLTVGVNNAFDRNPPIVLGAFNDNYDTSNYSIRNRYWYVQMSKKF